MAFARFGAELEGSKRELFWVSSRSAELESLIEQTRGAQTHVGARIQFKVTQVQSFVTLNPGSNTARVVFKLRKLAKKVSRATQLVRKMRRSE